MSNTAMEFIKQWIKLGGCPPNLKLGGGGGGGESPLASTPMTGLED